MPTLSRTDLWSLEEYAERRPTFRAEVIAHKQNRQVALGANARLYFEDTLTIRYQIQEMLRIEKVFEAAGIEEELEAYNPLIPDGDNWKATFMIEFDNPVERAEQLSKMIGIEDKVWICVEGFRPVFAIADEDLERTNEVKTSSVHFMRFQLDTAAISAVQNGASIRVGIDHPAYTVEGITLAQDTRDSLAGDLKHSTLN